MFRAMIMDDEKVLSEDDWQEQWAHVEMAMLLYFDMAKDNHCEGEKVATLDHLQTLQGYIGELIELIKTKDRDRSIYGSDCVTHG